MNKCVYIYIYIYTYIYMYIGAARRGEDQVRGREDGRGRPLRQGGDIHVEHT